MGDHFVFELEQVVNEIEDIIGNGIKPRDHDVIFNLMREVSFLSQSLSEVDIAQEQIQSRIEVLNRSTSLSYRIFHHFQGLAMERIPLVEQVDTMGMCTICLEEFIVDQMVMKLNCGHSFHNICLKPWLTEDSCCTLCRDRVYMEDYGG